jgi:2-polyprenyl-3-methyl-5-hydroxy-6-metoxy-1,4-benzoquinol methylase
METLEIDQTRVDAFSDKMMAVLNGGALALMTSIGHRTGLFDVMHKLSPSTSEDIAQSAGLNERYVREWLGAMVVGKIVEYNPELQTYFLPLEHAACLTREATPDNLAVFTQYIPLLGTVEDRILECFQRGGGVPYEKYGRFHKVMAEDSGQTVIPALIDSILPLAPGLTDDLERGINVLDIGCGSGRALNLMAEAFPGSRFVGFDLSEDAVETGKTDAARAGLTNVRFEQQDMTFFETDTQYDLITAFDAIHDQARPDKVLVNIANALHPNGTFLMQDIAGSRDVEKNIDNPVAPLLYTISVMHCMSVSLAQGGAGLGTMWGEETARQMLRDAGFTQTETRKIPHDFQNVYYINTKK